MCEFDKPDKTFASDISDKDCTCKRVVEHWWQAAENPQLTGLFQCP